MFPKIKEDIDAVVLGRRISMPDKIHNLPKTLKAFFVEDARSCQALSYFKELEILEEENPEFFDSNSPTQRVGGEVTKNFNTIRRKELHFT